MGLGGALASPEVKKIYGKNLIIKEKFRVFLENLGIRGKICRKIFLLNVHKKFLLYVRKIFFSPFFVYVRKF
jgi:hypothetical protein